MTTLTAALASCDMLLIDGLHASDFTFDDTGLRIYCMDGRQHRRWAFTSEQVAAAVADGNDWRLAAAETQHHLVCLSAFRAPDEDSDETELEVPAER